jgi:rhodanese-related sulfurtransferase
MNRLFVLLATLFLAIGTLQAKEYKDNCLLDTHTFPQDAAIIDVRTPKEFALGHPKGAVNIPYELEKDGAKEVNPNFVSEVNRFTKENYEAPLIIICRIGVRSVKASVDLAKEGYEDITNIQKGFMEGWKKAGMPIEK